MNKDRFNEIDQNIQQLDPNAPFILKLDHDALHRELNPEQYNLPQALAENDHPGKLIKPEPSTSTQMNEEAPPKIKKKTPRKEHQYRWDKYFNFIKLDTANFFSWNIYSHESVQSGWVGKTMFFSDNKIITMKPAKKHSSVHKSNENEEDNLSPKC